MPGKRNLTIQTQTPGWETRYIPGKPPTLAQLRKMAKAKGVDFGANPHGHEYDLHTPEWRMNIQAENDDYAGLRKTVGMILCALPYEESR